MTGTKKKRANFGEKWSTSHLKREQIAIRRSNGPLPSEGFGKGRIARLVSPIAMLQLGLEMVTFAHPVYFSSVQ